MLLKKDLYNFDVNFFITSTKRNGQKWTLLNFTSNVCDLLNDFCSRRKLFPYMLLGELHKTNPDFPKKCPFRKVIYWSFSRYKYNYYINFMMIFFLQDNLISIRNLSINFDKINGCFPQLSVNHIMTFIKERKAILRLFIKGSVKSDWNI